MHLRLLRLFLGFAACAWCFSFGRQPTSARIAVPAHLTIKTDGLSFDSLLSDWRWLVQPKYTPIPDDGFRRFVSPRRRRACSLSRFDGWRVQAGRGLAG